MDFNRLPNEILNKIQEYVNSTSRARLRRTCMRMDSIVKKAREAKKRIYYLGLRFDDDLSRAWNPLDNVSDVYYPTILEKQCEYRLIAYKDFPKIDKTKLKLHENPRRVVQQTLEKYPNVEVLGVEAAIIDKSFFEQVLAAGVRLSEIGILFFDYCVFELPLIELRSWFSQIRLICFDWCSPEVVWAEQESLHNKFSRLLYYGEDIALPGSTVYDWNAWRIRDGTLSAYHAIDFIKAMIERDNVVSTTYTFPMIMVHITSHLETSPERRVDYLEAIASVKELDSIEGCTVNMSESISGLLIEYAFGEYIIITVKHQREERILEFNLLLSYHAEIKPYSESI